MSPAGRLARVKFKLVVNVKPLVALSVGSMSIVRWSPVVTVKDIEMNESCEKNKRIVCEKETFINVITMSIVEGSHTIELYI